MKKKTLVLVYEDNVLKISGERKELEEKEKCHYSESFYGSFARQFNLPHSANDEKGVQLAMRMVYYLLLFQKCPKERFNK